MEINLVQNTYVENMAIIKNGVLHSMHKGFWDHSTKRKHACIKNARDELLEKSRIIYPDLSNTS